MDYEVSLIRELNAQREKTVGETSLISEEQRLLLSPGGDKERQALRIAGIDHEILEAQKKIGIEIDRKRGEENYKNSVFTKDEVKNICVKYDLRFLSSSDFIGDLGSDAPKEMASFIKENPEIGQSNCFYIIASEEYFHLNRHNNNTKKTKKGSKAMILYKEPHNDNYVLINSWGSYSILRRIRGLYMESFTNMHIYGAIIFSIPFTLLFALTSLSFVGTIGDLFIVPVIFLGGFLVNLAFMAIIMYNDDENFASRASENVWNNTKERKLKKNR